MISGQFNGLTIPQLWATCYTYFIITFLFDLLGGFVKDNILVITELLMPLQGDESLLFEWTFNKKDI